MTKEDPAWPFGDDALQDDPLTAFRVPVVGSFNPKWKYIAAYLNTSTSADYLSAPPFASNQRPTEIEGRMIASFIREYLAYWFSISYIEELSLRPLDVDSRCNTTVFIKYGIDDWGYRLISWQYGPTFIPERGGPLSLEQVMDRAHTYRCDKPTDRWQNWKATHPDVFPGVKKR